MEDLPSNKSNKSFFTPLLTSKIAIGAIFKSIVMLALFCYCAKTADINTASSLLFIFLVGHELLYSFSCRNIKKSVLNKNIFSNIRLTIGVFSLTLIQIIVLTTGLSKYFIVGNLNLQNVSITIIVLFLTFIIGELVKPIYNKLFKDYTKGKNYEK